MRKADIVEGEAYVVNAPGEYGRTNQEVKAVVRRVGIERERYGRRSPRLDGVACVLGEPHDIRVRDAVTHRSVERTMQPGEEFVVSTAEVRRPWDEEAQRRLERRAQIREHNARLREIFERLGLEENRRERELAPEGSSDPWVVRDVHGFVLGKDGRVIIDADALLAWLERIEDRLCAGAEG